MRSVAFSKQISCPAFYCGSMCKPVLAIIVAPEHLLPLDVRYTDFAALGCLRLMFRVSGGGGWELYTGGQAGRNDSIETSMKPLMTVSAPAASSCWEPPFEVTPMHRNPADRADSTPAGASSKARACAGATPSRPQASRYTWGWGLPRLTSAAVMMASK